MTEYVCFCYDPPDEGDGTRTDGGGGCVFVCKNRGGGATVWTHTPDLQPAYSTAPVLSVPIIQSLKENLILLTPPPPKDESDQEDKEGDSFDSGLGGGSK